MKIQILCDNPTSWIIPYAKQLVELIQGKGVDCNLLHDPAAVKEGDVLALLSCEQIFKNLHLNRYNLVVHESALPQGKGWSPLTWQVLEGKTKIPITLFEAAENVDAGEIYLVDNIELEGTELVEDLRKKQGEKTINLILQFLEMYPDIKGKKQEGASTFYLKRGPKNSELNVNQTLAEQFNLLRVCDNEKYPAFFYYQGKKYKIKIEHYEE
jgi:methionyl-tRNA formyltransferase